MQKHLIISAYTFNMPKMNFFFPINLDIAEFNST